MVPHLVVAVRVPKGYCTVKTRLLPQYSLLGQYSVILYRVVTKLKIDSLNINWFVSTKLQITYLYEYIQKKKKALRNYLANLMNLNDYLQPDLVFFLFFFSGAT